MKRVYLDIPGKRHSLYDELTSFPPDGYEYVREDTSWDRITKLLSHADFVYSLQKNLMARLLPVNLTKAYLERFKKLPANVDLTYSSGHVVFRREPWVVDMEFVTHLVGYDYTHFLMYKRYIEKALSSVYCRRIMPWTDAGKRTILATIGGNSILEKVETVHLAVRPKRFVKNYDKDEVKFLFVGSVNIPKDFEIKGGKEVLDAFCKLSKVYNNLELFIRSYVPSHIKRKFEGINNIRIVDEIIPWNDLEEEFKSSDIFLFPSHHTPGLAILDAMSYELPVITTDVWANPEMVVDGKNGFLVRKSEEIQYYKEGFIPNWSSPRTLRSIRKGTDPRLVGEIVEKASILIEDSALRKRMGKAGRQEIESGKYSIKRRNEKLKRIFDESTA
jgi:glycosyltransferase involved in cell wall biosynthesis